MQNYSTKKRMEGGKIHLYTGNGKGKTTAAIGLAIRAVGSGKSVFIAQFVKGMHYSELEALKQFDKIKIKQYGLDCFIKNQPTQKDIDVAKKGLNEIKKYINNKNVNVLILDELCIALHYKLFDFEDLHEILSQKDNGMEIVITGRYASKELIKTADLVTEMKEIKHYYNNGVIARKGIEY